MKISITVNGAPCETEPEISLFEFIRQLGFEPRSVAALVNGEIVEQNGFAERLLKENDIVELVRFVPGG